METNAMPARAVPACFFAAFPLCVAAITAFAPAVCAQTPTPAPVPAAQVPLSDRLAALAKAVEAKRVSLHVPGAALVVVQNDQIIYMEGMGYRNVAKKEPVTPDTVFAIGSSSKAFTSFAVLLGEIDGKLSLTDSPRKYLPYFALQDSNANAKITLRDLMCHNSGLPRTDLLWYTNALTRREAISALAYVKPTAPFGEKFQYQNICFAAAGEAVARAENTSYEAFVQNRVFGPLNMTHTTFSTSQMQNAPDFAVGYAPQTKTKPARPLPLHPLQNISPAGGINSSARDMAQWLRLLTNGGTFENKTLLPTPEFEKLSAKQMKIGGTINYGLGWFVRDWDGHKVVEHGGNIDGFNAEVAFMPDQKLGFVLLTNVSSSPLGESALDAVWNNLVGKKASAAAVAATTGGEAVPAASEAGTYVTPGFSGDVTAKGDKLMLTVAGQPPYPLVPQGGRRYKLDTPAPDGFFITFRPKKNKPTETEAFLEQPQGNLTLSRLAPPPQAIGAEKELVGKYTNFRKSATLSVLAVMEIAIRNGRLTLLVPGQAPYALVPVDKNTYTSPSLPDSYQVLVRRDPQNKVSGIVLKQPQGDVLFVRKAGTEKPFASPITPAALLAKIVTAYGGEKALRRHTTRQTESAAVIASQGLTARITEWNKAPNLSASQTVLLALKPPKAIGTVRDTFNGKISVSAPSFGPPETVTEGEMAWDDAKRSARFAPLLDGTAVWKSVKITGRDSVYGEPVYVVQKTPAKGNAVTEYVSTKTFRILRRDTLSTSGEGDEAQTVPVSETYSDFRNVDGELLPFRILTKRLELGDVVQTVQKIQFNKPIADAVFRPAATK